MNQKRCIPLLPVFSLLSILMLYIVTGAGAQESKVHWGITVPLTAKLPLVKGEGNAYSFWGGGGICVSTLLEGAGEQDLSLMNKTGFLFDVTQYKTKYGSFGIDKLSFFLNPEILFPTSNSRLKISAGIGVEWNGYFLAQAGAETGGSIDNDALDKARKKLLPSLSAGLFYNLKHGIFIQVFLRQNMMNSFSADTQVSLRNNPADPDLNLYQLPTYLGLAFSYFFN